MKQNDRIHLATPCWWEMNLAIELKKEKGGRVSASQREWIAALEARGYRAFVAKGLEAAKEVLTEYLGTPPSSGI